jgi:NADPH2:quinone reductase
MPRYRELGARLGQFVRDFSSKQFRFDAPHMKALVSHEPGGPETLSLEEVADPECGPNDVLVAVRVCALNFPDALIIRDLYQIRPPRPFSPGSEVAGEVVATGANVTQWRKGDMVFGLTLYGGLAEKVVIPARNCHRVPHGMSMEDAGALLLTYGTACHALRQRADIQPGERLLVIGASGGTGLAAVQLGRAMGAHVIAATSSEEKSALAMEHGAHEAFVYPRGPFKGDARRELSAIFKEGCQNGAVDVIFDSVGGEYAEAAFRTMGWRGRFLVIGFPAGIPQIPLNLPLLKGAAIIGVFFGTFTEREPELHGANVAELLDLYERGLIRPAITQRLALEHAGQGIAAMADRRAEGKILVRVS